MVLVVARARAVAVARLEEVTVAVGAAVEAAGGDRAAVTAAKAAGLEARAVRSSGESVKGLVAVSSGVLGAVGRPEWSMEASGTGERARMPVFVGRSGLDLLAMAIN